MISRTNKAITPSTRAKERKMHTPRRILRQALKRSKNTKTRFSSAVISIFMRNAMNRPMKNGLRIENIQPITATVVLKFTSSKTAVMAITIKIDALPRLSGWSNTFFLSLSIMVSVLLRSAASSTECVKFNSVVILTHIFLKNQCVIKIYKKFKNLYGNLYDEML